ncbi:MAG: alpha-2-macroglobulin family protein [Candidatus Omnitrophota bacterium]
MNTKCLVILLLLSAATLARAEINIDRDHIKLERSDKTVTAVILLENPAEASAVNDMTATLMDERYRPLAKGEKKVILLNGKQTERIAFPIDLAAEELEKCILSIDFAGQIWLKHFSPKRIEQELRVIGQNQWLSGSRAALRVIVTQSQGGAPIENAEIKVWSRPSGEGKTLFHADDKTDAEGTASIAFDIPGDMAGERTLGVSVKSEYGEDEATAKITIQTGTKIFLTTDKPVYQPGQLMRLRALAAHKATGKPLPEQPIALEVYDGKGNKVFKKMETTSEYGVASADFQLADEVNQGDYAVKAIIGDDMTEKTAQVFEYVLPKFRVTAKNENEFYAPGDAVKGALEARYFFGKAVAGAKATITVNCFDVGFNEFEKVEGTTDEEGRWNYSFTIPERLVGQPLFKGNTIIQMDVRVRDSADHEEQKIETFHVAVEPLQIEAIPESGTLVDGVMNEVFLVASRPDGSVAKPTLTVQSRYLQSGVKVDCDDNGIASIILTPTPGENVYRPELPPLRLFAEIDGKKITLDKNLPFSNPEERILLRPDKGVYSLGEEMKLQAMAPFPDKEPVFLDIVKNNQTVLTRTLTLENGKAQLAIALDESLAGTLAMNAYMIRGDGHMIRDSRQVIVTRRDDLRIDIAPDQEQYEPGQPAKLRILVRGADGQPAQVALGLHIVDESVYSLTEKEPGLAKVFFAIEKELLQPKVEIHGYRLDKVVRLSAKDYEDNARLSKTLLAKLDVHADFSLNLNTADEKTQKAIADLQRLQSEVLSQQSLAVSRKPRNIDELLWPLGQDLQNLPTIDPWGNPYIVYMNDNIWLASAGRDGKAVTDDDIRLPAFRFGYFFQDAGEKGGQLKKAAGIVEKWGEHEVRLAFPAQTGMLRRGGAIMGMDGLGRGVMPGVAGGMGGMAGGGRVNRFAMAKGVPALRGEMAVPEAPPVVVGEEVAQFGLAEAPAAREGLAQMRVMAVEAAPPNAPGDRGGQAGASVYGIMGRPADNRKLVIQEDLELDMSTAQSAPHQIDRFYLYEEAQENKNLIEENIKSNFGGENVNGPLVVNGQLDEKQLKQAAEKFGDLSSLKLAEGEIAQLLKEKKEQTQEADASTAIKRAKDRSVRVRRYFPETLFYTPEAITDDKGEIALNIPPADSITTWRMSAMANAKNGAIGDATAAMKVFKPFFIDIDLPIALIQNDEVTIPVAVYNYLSTPQEVEASLEPSPWFDLLEGGYDRKVSIAANEVTSVTFRIQAKRLGKQTITVYGWGSQDNDAIGREIEVRPNGEAKFETRSGKLSGLVEQIVEFPAERIAGADKLFVKIYPGVFSQIVEGLDAILQMPYGCFEQTSSTTYPNILALNYMKQTGRVTPAVEMKAREYINLGYQRLLTFEIPGGGFQVFGTPPATRILSGYGLMEFMDMAQVYPIDENVIARTQQWLLGQMNDDGSFNPDENYAHAEMWSAIQNNKILATAYIALALEQSSAGPRVNPLSRTSSNIAAQTAAPKSANIDPQLQKTKQYLFAHTDDAKDAYTLAILCNALLALDPQSPATQTCVDRLVEVGIIEGERMVWKAEASMSFARGDNASVEATAWAALALLADGRFHSELGKALNWIIEQKDPNGTWGTTHGTVLALKALLYSLGQRTESANAEAVISVNGEEAQKIKITPQDSDVFRQIDLTRFAKTDKNRIEINLNGEGNLLYQVVGKYFVPWDKSLKVKPAFDIKVEYDRSQLRRNDAVTCNVIARNTLPQQAEMVMIDVGIPPGFRVEKSALDDYQDDQVISKYTLMSRQLLIYLESMEGNTELKLAIPMKATLPIVAKAPESSIYEYYNPDVKDVSTPQELIVE